MESKQEGVYSRHQCKAANDASHHCECLKSDFFHRALSCGVPALSPFLYCGNDSVDNLWIKKKYIITNPNKSVEKL
jgi:hypothetical protein